MQGRADGERKADQGEKASSSLDTIVLVGAPRWGMELENVRDLACREGHGWIDTTWPCSVSVSESLHQASRVAIFVLSLVRTTALRCEKLPKQDS